MKYADGEKLPRGGRANLQVSSAVGGCGRYIQAVH
jgi:hypothetical protein